MVRKTKRATPIVVTDFDDQQYKDHVSRLLRAQRLNLGLFQDEAAALVGLKRSGVYDVESGKFWPHLTTLLHYTTALGLHPCALFPPTGNATLAQLYRILPLLSPDLQQAILILAQDQPDAQEKLTADRAG
jgi:DNA-binding XRE family transcriptional regulator